jgi:hypothetical protein
MLFLHAQRKRLKAVDDQQAKRLCLSDVGFNIVAHGIDLHGRSREKQVFSLNTGPLA